MTIDKASQKSQAKILIFEDDQEIAKVLELRLGLAGYNTQAAHNGRDGLDMIAGFEPDVILLDLRMPIMGGIEVLRELRQTSDLGTLPIIILSANVDGESKRIAQKLGARYFIDKPYEASRLLSLVGNVLETSCQIALTDSD